MSENEVINVGRVGVTPHGGSKSYIDDESYQW